MQNFGQKVAQGTRLYRAWAQTSFAAKAPEFGAWLEWKATASASELEAAEFDAEYL